MSQSIEQRLSELEARLKALETFDPYAAMPRVGPDIPDRTGIGEKIYRDQIGRPSSAYCLWLATIQAVRLGIKTLQVFEFGVAHGAGLLNLCNICAMLTEATDVEFQIFGFDSDVGMPPLVDYRDHPEIWHQGEFLSNHDWIRGQLSSNAELISGNVKDTVGAFVASRTSEASPIGFVIIDVDLYSSALQCFELFKHPNPNCYLPTTLVYMDDVNDLLTTSSWTGEKLAVSEFNFANPMRKLEELRGVRKNHPRAGWHSHVHGLHVLEHRARKGELPGVVLDINITAL